MRALRQASSAPPTRLLLRALVPLLALLTLAAGSVAYSAARDRPPEPAPSIDLPYGSALIVADVASERGAGLCMVSVW